MIEINAGSRVILSFVVTVLCRLTKTYKSNILQYSYHFTKRIYLKGPIKVIIQIFQLTSCSTSNIS